MKYPYRVGEVPLKSIKKQKFKTKYSKIRTPDRDKRTPVAFSAGPTLGGSVGLGASCPQPDPTDPISLAVGAQARITAHNGEPNKKQLSHFLKFWRRYLRATYKPLPPDTYLDTLEQLKDRPWPLKKKMKMQKEWLENNEEMKPEHYEFGMFCKDEVYQKYAHSRIIASPSDMAKLRFGPVVWRVEEQAYNTPEFIKKVPVNERPAWLKAKFSGKYAAFTAADFTSFECSFTKELKETIEMEFMEHMTQYLPGHEQWMKDFRRWLIPDKFHLKNRNFSLSMADSSRASGEITTSLFNGIANIAIHKYFAYKTNQKVEIAVEGDDSLAGWTRRAPTQEFYQSLGFDVKIEYHQTLETTSFCGQVFADQDEAVMTDPRYVLANVGWLPVRYMDARKSVHMCLLRAKAWSMGYQYQACPILSACARWLLRVTRSHDPTKAYEYLDLYKAEQLKQALDAGLPVLNKEPGMQSRLLMEQLYGVDISTQLAYEAFFDEQQTITEIPNLFTNIPSSWTEFHENYVRSTLNLRSLVTVPPEVFHTPHKILLQVPLKTVNKSHQKYIKQFMETRSHRP